MVGLHPPRRAGDHNMLAALVRPPDESPQQLLHRAVQLALDEEIYTVEINPPLAPSRR